MRSQIDGDGVLTAALLTRCCSSVPLQSLLRLRRQYYK